MLIFCFLVSRKEKVDFECFYFKNRIILSTWP
jgi:hypothetical protein